MCTFAVAVPRGLRHIRAINRSGADTWGEVVGELVMHGGVPVQGFRVFRYGEYVDNSTAHAGTGAMMIPYWRNVSFFRDIPEVTLHEPIEDNMEERTTRPQASLVTLDVHVWFAEAWVWVDAAFQSEVHWTWADIKRFLHERFPNLIPHSSTFCLVTAVDPCHVLHDEGYIQVPPTGRILAVVPLVG
jgi:hypothetical protein